MSSTILLPESVPAIPGSIIRFSYPKRNEFGVWTKMRQRCLLVEEIRDTSVNPIEPWAVEDNPFRRRGRWLVKGIDLEIGEERSFYWESMRSQARDTWLKLGFYDPWCDSDGIHFVEGRYAPTREARIYLQELIREFNKVIADRADEYRTLGVFSEPLRHERKTR